MTLHEYLTLPQRNILEVYNKASVQDRVEGSRWYRAAQETCQELSRLYNVDPLVVTIIMSVLSPATPWEKNVEYCEKLLSDFANESVEVEDGVYTVYKANAQKAVSFLEDGFKAFCWYYQDITKIKSGHKTLSFAHNMWGNETEYVTIDRHSYRVWKLGYSTEPVTPPRLSGKQYVKIVDDYKVVAEFLGVSPSTLQAVTWVTIRRLLHPVSDK
jgi:hypothetical protein